MTAEERAQAIPGHFAVRPEDFGSIPKLTLREPAEIYIRFCYTYSGDATAATRHQH